MEIVAQHVLVVQIAEHVRPVIIVDIALKVAALVECVNNLKKFFI
jgi:hypothetical protein